MEEMRVELMFRMMACSILKNNAFGFSVKNIEDYLHNSSNNDYKSSCKNICQNIQYSISVQCSENKRYGHIDLKQRQLFDLD